jgi:ankyrin repeat protein
MQQDIRRQNAEELCRLFRSDHTHPRIEALIDEADVDWIEEDTRESLLMLIVGYRPDLLGRVLHKCRNINNQDRHGQTILHFICDGDLRCYKLLSNVPNYIHVKDERGLTPLHSLCIVALNIVIQGNEWWSNWQNKIIDGLMERIVFCCDAIDFLIQCGADINTQDNQGRTPLHIAIIVSCRVFNYYKDDFSFVIVDHLLHQCGARYDIPDRCSETAWQLARTRKVTPIVDMIHKLHQRLHQRRQIFSYLNECWIANIIE